MQKTYSYKRCLRAAAFTLAMAIPMSGLAESYKVVTGGALNLRKEPSMKSGVIHQYPSGTWMTVLSEEGEWSKVEVGGNTGYVMSKFLSNSNSDSTLYVRTNTGRGLNLRDMPSLEGNIITSFKPGTAVKVLVRGAGWHKVSVGDQVGYMNAQFLSGSASGGSSSSSKTGTVSNPGANQVLLLRETASTDARVLGYFGNGTKVTIHGEEGDFYKVTVGGKKGYMMKKFIKLNGSSSSTLPATPFAAELVNPNGNSIVNFRTAPGLSSPIIKAHRVGTQINVLEVGETWCKAEIDGVTGYVSRYFFKVSR
ncbi:MAG: SH3 domain-containing protein [Clostridia bacterium]|nr:SH3 domain-containing protein [Clostridia bacterium]